MSWTLFLYDLQVFGIALFILACIAGCLWCFNYILKELLHD